jgi:hypothetical protein
VSGRATAAALLRVTGLATVLAAAPAGAQVDVLSKQAFIVLVDHVTPEQLLLDPTMRRIASRGGIALMTGVNFLPDLLEDEQALGPGRRPTGQRYRPRRPGATIPGGRPIGLIEGAPVFDFGSVDRLTETATQFAIADIIEDLEFRVRRTMVSEALVVIASPTPSAEMLTQGSEVTSILMGTGSPDELFGPATDEDPQLDDTPTEEIPALTSDTTRRDGVVATVDVIPTVQAYLRRPHEGLGSPIRPVGNAGTVVDLYGRHLASRQMSVPVGTVAALYVTVAGAFAAVVARWRRRAPRWLARIAMWGTLTVAPLAASLLAAGHADGPTYRWVAVFVAGITAGAVAVALLARRLGVLVPPALLGLAAAVYLAVETLTGWDAALTPILGGSVLHGARFYGMPNVAIGLLLGGVLYAAASLRLAPGVALLALAALLAGLPGLGANLGGSVSLFSATGMWFAIERSERHRLAFRESVLAAAVAGVGIAVVVVAHAMSPRPTHVASAGEGGAVGLVATYLDRLGEGASLVLRNPAAALPGLGLIVLALLMRNPPRSLRVGLDLHPVWHRAMLVLLIASIVAYLANDTGPAAAGLGFGLTVAGLLYVTLADRVWNVETT